MNQLKEYAETIGCNFTELYNKVLAGIEGADIRHFTDEELSVIREALEVAGEL